MSELDNGWFIVATGAGYESKCGPFPDRRSAERSVEEGLVKFHDDDDVSFVECDTGCFGTCQECRKLCGREQR